VLLLGRLWPEQQRLGKPARTITLANYENS
jgi:hypothetical protein